MSSLKFSSKKAFSKRFKILSRGVVKHWHSNTSHRSYKKTNKQKRHLRKACILNSRDWNRIKKMIGH